MTSTISNLQSLPGTLASNGASALESARKTASPITDSGVSTASAATQKPDQANLSTLGALVAASAGTDVRLDKVSELRQAIQAGTYNVPASAVAGKIVDSLLS